MRRLLAIAFVLAALAPNALSAQGSSSPSNSHATSTKTATTKKATTANKNHKSHGKNPWWSRSVYINAGNASQYLAPTAPPKPPPKNKVNTGGEVFKKISN